MSFSTNIKEFLNQERILRLASINKDGLPHLVPLCFIFFKGKIWIHAEGRRKRHQNFNINPKVTLLIDKYFDENWKLNKGVLIEGEVIIHPKNSNEAKESQKALEEKFPQYRSRWENENVAMVEITTIKIKQWRIDPQSSLY